MQFDLEELSKKSNKDLDDIARQNIHDRYLLRAIFDILTQRDRRTAKETRDWILQELQRTPRVRRAGLGPWHRRPLLLFTLLVAAAIVLALALAVNAGVLDIAWLRL
jgi:hypothetical protein